MSEVALDYGPLQGLIGVWQGSDGMDVAPEPSTDDHNPYYETITFEAAGDVDNAETQELAVVRYHQVVSRKRNDKVFHNESGYLTWQSANQSLMLTFTIPRGVAVVAQGELVDEGDATILRFQSRMGTEWGIVESPFMAANAHTQQFTRELRLQDTQLSYKQTTEVAIYGRIAQHTDQNILHRAN